MEHPAGWELPWSAGRPREDFSSGETIFDELVFGELQPGLLVDEPGSGFRFDEPPAEQLLQGPPEELPSPARSEPGTPPPSPVRPASLSDSPAEAMPHGVLPGIRRLVDDHAPARRAWTQTAFVFRQPPC